MENKYLGKLVVAKNTQGEIIGVGQCVAFIDRPTLSFNTLNGQQVHWIADMCEVAQIDPKAVDIMFDQKAGTNEQR